MRSARITGALNTGAARSPIEEVRRTLVKYVWRPVYPCTRARQGEAVSKTGVFKNLVPTSCIHGRLSVQPLSVWGPHVPTYADTTISRQRHSEDGQCLFHAPGMGDRRSGRAVGRLWI